MNSGFDSDPEMVIISMPGQDTEDKEQEKEQKEPKKSTEEK